MTAENNPGDTNIQVISSALEEVKKADRLAETNKKNAADHYLNAISKLKTIKSADDSRASEVAGELLTHTRHRGKLLIEDSSLSNVKNIDDIVSEMGIREDLDTGEWIHRTPQNEESIVEDVRKTILKADQLQRENSYDEAINLYKEARRTIETELTNTSVSLLATEIGVGLRRAQRNKRTAERPTPKQEPSALQNRTQTNESPPDPTEPGHSEDTESKTGSTSYSETESKKYKYSLHNYHADKDRDFGKSYYEFNTNSSFFGLFSNSYTLHIVNRRNLIAVEKPTDELFSFSGWRSASIFFGFNSTSSGCPVSEKADKIVAGKPEVRLCANMQSNLPHQIEERGHYHGVVIELSNDTIAAPNDIQSVKKVFSRLDGINISSNTDDLY